MSRVKNADSAATIERIFAAARHVLERDELATLSLRKVARESGLSLGTVSYYFPSSNSLWEACVEEHYERVARFVSLHAPSLVDAASRGDALRLAAREAFAFALEERVMIRLLHTLAARDGGVSQRHLTQRSATMRALLGHLCDSRRSPLDLALCAQTLVYACARHVCSSPEERMALTGASSEPEANAEIAEHLANLAVTLLLGDAPPTAQPQ